MPQELQEWLPRAEILSYEETLRLIRIAAGLGVTKVRITGGEPLTRRGIVDFIREVPKIPGIRDVGVSTNGTLLAREITPNETMAAVCELPAFARLISRSIPWIKTCMPGSPGVIFFLRYCRESARPSPPGSSK